MKKLIGEKVNLIGGHKLELDIPAGEVKVIAVSTVEENYSIQHIVKTEVEVLLPTPKEMIEMNADEIQEQMEYALAKRDGNWVTFYYTDPQVNENYYNMVVSEMDFKKMLVK